MTEYPPGWYPDPIDRGVQRYWDGEQWIGAAIPADQTPPATPPPAVPESPFGTDPAVAASAGAAVAASAGGGSRGRVPAATAGRIATGSSSAVLTLAPLHARFLARFVDVLAVTVLNVAVNGWFVYRWWREVAPAYRKALAGQTVEASEIGVNLEYAIVMIGLALWFAYEVPAVAATGQTLGKRLFEIRVTGHDGQALGWVAAWRRWMFMSLPTLLAPCLVPLQLLDSLWCTWDRPLRQCLHDKWARTVVVQADAARPADTTTGAHGSTTRT